MRYQIALCLLTILGSIVHPLFTLGNSSARSSSATSSAVDLLLLENKSWPANCRGVISFCFSSLLFSAFFSNLCFGSSGCATTYGVRHTSCERWRNIKISRKMRNEIYYLFSVHVKVSEIDFSLYCSRSFHSSFGLSLISSVVERERDARICYRISLIFFPI